MKNLKLGLGVAVLALLASQGAWALGNISCVGMGPGNQPFDLSILWGKGKMGADVTVVGTPGHQQTFESTYEFKNVPGQFTGYETLLVPQGSSTPVAGVEVGVHAGGGRVGPIFQGVKVFIAQHWYTLSCQESLQAVPMTQPLTINGCPVHSRAPCD